MSVVLGQLAPVDVPPGDSKLLRSGGAARQVGRGLQRERCLPHHPDTDDTGHIQGNHSLG